MLDKLKIIFTNIPKFFDSNKIKKENCNFKNIKNIEDELIENSDVYNSMTNANIQNVLKVIETKKIKNIEYKERYFFDYLLYKILNLKYIPNIWGWKSTFSYLKDILLFNKFKKKFVTSLYVFISVFLFNFFFYLSGNLYISYKNYSQVIVNKMTRKYRNPFTLEYMLEDLENKYKKPWIDKQTLFVIYFVILTIMLFNLIKTLDKKNKIKWGKEYQNFIVIYLIFLELLNKIESYWNNMKDIPYYNIKKTTFEVIENLKNEELISLDLYNKIVSVITNNFSYKPKWFNPSLLTFLKVLKDKQSRWEKIWFKWTLNETITIYETVKQELFEQWQKNEWFYKAIVLLVVFWIQFLMYIIIWSYFFSPVVKSM